MMNNQPCETITYGELRNGDRIWVQGVLFEVQNVRVSSRQGERVTMHSEPNRVDLIRFEGAIIDDQGQRLKGTSYDGGTYGGYADRLATVLADRRVALVAAPEDSVDRAERALGVQ